MWNWHDYSQSLCEHRNDRNFIKTKRLPNNKEKHKTKSKPKRNQNQIQNQKSKQKQKNALPGKTWKIISNSRFIWFRQVERKMSAPATSTTATTTMKTPPTTIFFRKRIIVLVFFVQFLDIFVCFRFLLFCLCFAQQLTP